jgi:6-pyruvoyltetrahydropterin/6-carboxytetrahydropterin synthase
VIDFAAVLSAMKSILAEIDHAVLLPANSKQIHVTAGDEEVEVRFGDRRWIFPREECRLLPISSTTVELMANYLAERLLTRLAEKGLPRPAWLRIELEESPGCSAMCEL